MLVKKIMLITKLMDLDGIINGVVCFFIKKIKS